MGIRIIMIQLDPHSVPHSPMTSKRRNYFLFLLCFVFLTQSRSVSALIPTWEANSRTIQSLYATSSSPATQIDTVDLEFTEFSNHHQQHYDAPPVLLMHGLLGQKRNFASIATALSAQLERKRRIIAIDLRNHGESEWRYDMEYQTMVQDVEQFLDQQLIEKVVLVGHSMGGKLAQALALTNPERVEGLVSIDIAPVAYSRDEPHWKAVEDIVLALHRIQLEPGVTKRQVDLQLQSFIDDPALRAFCLTNLDTNKGQWKINIDAIAAQLDRLASFDIDGQYDGDAFFIHGGQSRFVRHAYMDAIRTFFPNHMLTTIRGAGRK